MAGSIDFKGKIISVDAADNLLVFKGEPSAPTEAGNYSVQQLLEYLDTALEGAVSQYLSQIIEQKTAAEQAATSAADNLATIQAMSRYLYVDSDGELSVND